MDGISDSVNMSLSKRNSCTIQETVKDREAVVHGIPKSWLFTTGDQNIGVSASALVLPKNIQG